MKLDIVDMVEKDRNYCDDNGTKELMSSVASYYGFELPTFLASKLLTAVGTKNRYLKTHPKDDNRIRYMVGVCENPNQLRLDLGC